MVRNMSGRCLEDVWTVSELCLEGVWKLSGRCLEDIVRVSSGCLDSVWKVFGMSLKKRFLEVVKSLTRKCLEKSLNGI